MKRWIALGMLGLCIAVAPAAFSGAQQEKMKTCSKQAKAKGLKGDERKTFMKGCLSKKAAAPAAQKEAASGK